MIAKGASRSGPRQLAIYLMRLERWETGEPVVLLEYQSPWANSLEFVKGADDIWAVSNPLVHQQSAAKLVEGFRDWQVLTEGTKQGRDGLYHAEISPAPEYADKMTAAQWKRAADILGQELGLQNQPRAVVLHGGTDGRKHMHVVWQRTDVDKMKLISDAYNYIAHEKASQRMELEFGHEFVPGKHAKRDRKRQEEFPRQKLTQDEDQYQKRTGLSKEDRIKQITELHKAADGGQAFKGALEDAGYILAKGARGYVVVDQKGGHSVLSRNIDGLREKDVNAFMVGIELTKLPTIEEAKAVQTERRKTASKSGRSPEPQKQSDAADPSSEAGRAKEEAPAAKGVEASKFLQPPEASKIPEPTPAPLDPQLVAIRKALAERQAEEIQKYADLSALELRRLEYELDRERATKLALRDREELQAIQDLKESIRERTTGVKGVIQAIENRWKPQLGAERAKERRHEIAALKRRQAKEREGFIALEETIRREQIGNLKTRHALRLHDTLQRHEEEKERYDREHEEAKRLRALIDTEHQELEKNQNLEDGPPPPKLGKS